MRSSTDNAVRLIGVEAGGEAIVRDAMPRGSPAAARACLQGTRTFVLQDDDGNIELTHSISAGLDYAAVGPSMRGCAKSAGPNTPT